MAAELLTQARISREKAQAKALARLASAARAEVVAAELEVERGCLVYSFDIRVPGKEGLTEILVDAGNGEVLSRKHESAEDEARESKYEGGAGGDSRPPARAPGGD